MKKQVAIVVPFCALLTISVFAPKMFWQNDHNISRSPSSETEDIIIDEKADIKTQDKQTSCLTDKQPAALEEEIKKLVADKEAILIEIENIKSSTVEIKNKKLVESYDKEILIALMSQMTSMMISQQEQQQSLMQQMFTMMNQMPMQSYPQQLYQPLTMPLNQQSSIFGYMTPGIGIGYQSQSIPSIQNPYEILARSPSAQPDPNFIQRDVNVQPQFQSEYAAGNMGFNFLSSDASFEMQRMIF